MTKHLYWAYDKDQSLFERVKTGISLCGQREVDRAQLTLVVKDVTCKKCTKKKGEQDGLRRKHDQAAGQVGPAKRS